MVHYPVCVVVVGSVGVGEGGSASQGPRQGPPGQAHVPSKADEASLVWVRAQCPLALTLGSGTSRKLSHIRPTLMAYVVMQTMQKS